MIDHHVRLGIADIQRPRSAAGRQTRSDQPFTFPASCGNVGRVFVVETNFADDCVGDSSYRKELQVTLEPSMTPASCLCKEMELCAIPPCCSLLPSGLS